MRDSTRMFLASVGPPIVSVVLLATFYLRGHLAAQNLLTGLFALACVWLVAAVWGYADWRCRQQRAKQKRRPRCR